ncbi:activating transcription factor 4b [Kryptolebias marmoratus]|uniref:Cyclic AMP-dependent transcription factor ATF-4 n=1 Tax=Kryptolebias marmoratus TaxID=37003 RepID=A0A3Q3GEP9_KRYMA|nr:activating transcription factor 4b [Kryptolebias marmoratus]
MTMTMTSSQFGLEDMEALLWPSSPTADAMDSLLANPDDVQQGGGGSSLRGRASPVSPLASSSPSLSLSPPPFYSPPHSPSAELLHGDKAGAESDLLPFSWFDQPGQLRYSQAPSGDRKEDVLGGFDWMGERVDLSDFDLDSLIDSCGPAEGTPNSSEGLLDSLDCSMELDPFQLPTLPALSSSSSAAFPNVPPPSLPTVDSDPSVVTVDEPESHVGGQEVPSSPLCVPDAQEELEIKSEPASPDPSPAVVDCPSSPAFTLDLGSEVDISESEVKTVVASVVPQVPKIVLSLSPTRIVLVLAPQNDVTATPGVIRCSPPTSSPQKSLRSRPYPEPKQKSGPSSPVAATSEVVCLRAAGGAGRASSKAPKDKKQKKMEQNKTAATRYRQKKRAEQDSLLTEYVQLERKNVELTEKAESMAREIEYLKELMDEVRQTRLKKGLSADP